MLGFVAEVEPVEGVLDTEVPVFAVAADCFFDEPVELVEPEATRPTAPDDERFTEPDD